MLESVFPSLYDQKGQRIEDLDDIPKDYYKKLKNGGLFLDIRTSEPPHKKQKLVPVTNELQLDGINLKRPHLGRQSLVQRLIDYCASSKFVLLSSPAGSGKTSLLTLFSANRDTECIYMSCLDERETLSDLFKPHGIDLESKTVTGDKPRVIMLDDAQKKPDFFIAATHSLDDTPVEFGSFPSLGRSDFLLSDTEARDFLKSDELGLPKHLQFDSLVGLISSECNGLIAALRLAIFKISIAYSKMNPTESTLLQYYLSDEITRAMARCFGSAHEKVPDHLKSYLISCLNGPCDIPNMKTDNYLILLQKCGILINVWDKVDYSSPLARRYFSKWLFRNRSDTNPSTLKELITKAIEHMSASFLEQSTPSTDDFPKEAVFQRLMLQGFAKNTKSDCSICPELSKRFPPFGADPNGEIDFYLKGSLRWGIELLINGGGIGEHLGRFATDSHPPGKYAALAVSDYAVVDFRVGTCTNVRHHPKRISVFFKKGDFSTCECIFGEEQDAAHLTLST